MVNVVTPFSSQKWDVSSKEANRIKRSLTLKAKASLFVAFVLVVLVIIVVVVCFVLTSSGNETPFWPSDTSNSKLGKYEKAALSTDAAPCAPIGRDILQRNGSAVDAAIAVLVCMGAHNPHSMGLGGGFLMLYYNRAEKRAYYLNARETAPAQATKDMFKGNATIAADGALSIAVPGELAGYSEAHRYFGRLEWKELFTPTIEMCRKGIEVSHHLAKAIRKTREKMMMFEDIRKVFLKNGTDVYEAGEYIKMPALANTLEAIADQRMKALYGPSQLADDFLNDLKTAGSIIDSMDMQGYSPQMLPPVRVNLRDNTTLYSVSTPGSGALLAFMMAVMDGYPDIDKSVTQDREMAALTYHRMVETFKFAYAHRSLMEDEDESKTTETKQLVDKLTSPEYAEKIRKLINDSVTFKNVSHYGGHFSFAEDHGTAHLSLVAPNGDAVTVTSTINQYFGSKILSKSTGIVLNDEMDDFSSPNITNSFDLSPTSKNSIRSGMRPMSSMAPMILVDSEGNVKLVLGGNGGSMITTSVMQVAANVLFFGEDIKTSIDAPRIHHQLTPNILQHEKCFPQAMVDDLQKFGHDTELWGASMMSIIMGVARGDDGYLYANSDYRKGGDVDGL